MSQKFHTKINTHDESGVYEAIFSNGEGVHFVIRGEGACPYQDGLCYELTETTPDTPKEVKTDGDKSKTDNQPKGGDLASGADSGGASK